MIPLMLCEISVSVQELLEVPVVPVFLCSPPGLVLPEVQRVPHVLAVLDVHQHQSLLSVLSLLAAEDPESLHYNSALIFMSQ